MDAADREQRMSYKGLVFAAAASMAMACASTAAGAAPVFAGLALERNDAPPVMKVDYYNPGYDRGEGPYYGDGAAGPSYWGYRSAEPGYEGDPAWNGEYEDVPAPLPYDGGPGLAAIPGAVIGGAVGVVTGALKGAAQGAARGSEYFSRPYYGPGYSYYGPGYYGSTSYGGGWGDYQGTFEDGSVAACERDFASFDPASGTYIDGNGVELLCPYLDR